MDHDCQPLPSWTYLTKTQLSRARKFWMPSGPVCSLRPTSSGSNRTFTFLCPTLFATIERPRTTSLHNQKEPYFAHRGDGKAKHTNTSQAPVRLPWQLLESRCILPSRAVGPSWPLASSPAQPLLPSRDPGDTGSRALLSGSTLDSAARHDFGGVLRDVGPCLSSTREKTSGR